MSVGHIELILGPMFAGKSTELLRRARRYGHAKQRVLLVKPACDTRYGALRVSTHDMQSQDATPLETLAAVWERRDEFDVLAVDEGQFFPDLAAECGRLADAGKVVVVSALSGTFERVPFPQVAALAPLCERADLLSAVCDCGADAPFSRLLRRDGVGADSVKIGGKGDYAAVCRACWNQ